MSYDIDFRVRVANTDKYISVGECEANVTWNVREIIEKSTGLPWLNEQNNGYCVDIIPKIQSGLTELIAHGNEYKKFEPDNGYGSVNGVIRFFNQIIRDWTKYIEYQDPEIVANTTFWII